MHAIAYWVITILFLSSFLAITGLLFIRTLDVLDHLKMWLTGGNTNASRHP